MFSKFFVVALACAVSPLLAGSTWETDLDSALKKAEGTNKSVLVEFTGSDWCGYCTILKKNVLDTNDFAEAAKDRFVLVELDFPRKKIIEAEQAKKNTAWKDKLKISGYPTIVLMDDKGKPFGNLVGSVDTTDDFLKIVSTWEKKRESRDQLFAEALKAEGLEKAKILVQALGMMPDDYYAPFYPEALNEIKLLDKDDSLGFQAKLLRKKTLQDQADNLMKIFMKYRKDVQTNDKEALQAAVKARQKEFMVFFNEEGTLPEIKQRILFQTEFIDSSERRNTEKMIETLKKIEALAPESGEGKHVASFIEQLQKAPASPGKGSIPAVRMVPAPVAEEKPAPATGKGNKLVAPLIKVNPQ